MNKILAPILLSLFCYMSVLGKEIKSSANSNKAQKVTLYISTADRSSDFEKKSINFNETSGNSATTITLDPSVRFQKMEGFGAAVTGSTCYNLMQMQPADRKKFLTETFSHEDGMGYSYIRISIGCSDFSMSEY
ncbi:MAG TPA: hypothetical protein VKA10_00185, partial [Prolixibacteraceae bacterium]|nr:hypothetical protein [Prolixibacteraceae bacterium]